MDTIDLAGLIINWDAISNRIYGVHWSSNLLDGIFQPLETNLYYPRHSYTDAVHAVESGGFYKLDVRSEKHSAWSRRDACDTGFAAIVPQASRLLRRTGISWRIT
jgi:hypothetical protein